MLFNDFLGEDRQYDMKFELTRSEQKDKRDTNTIFFLFDHIMDDCKASMDNGPCEFFFVIQGVDEMSPDIVCW